MFRTSKVSPLKVGKLPNQLLAKLLARVKITDEQVILGPNIGEDAAVIRLGSSLLVAKTDPITFATDLVGWYAVHVNANDIATRGVKPRWFLATILLPEAATAQLAEAILDQILSACNSLDISLVGGHTEVSLDFSRPVVAGCMFGEAMDSSIIATSGARPGDDIVLTKGVAIEGTAILARDARKQLESAGVMPEVLSKAANYLFSPGISVVKEALLASRHANIHCMHDPTEGGVSAGLWEIGLAARAGILVDKDRIPILPECQVICNQLGLDPLGLLASGALLITLSPSDTPRLLGTLVAEGIEASVIGKVVEATEGMKLHYPQGDQPLPGFERDELARFLEGLPLPLPIRRQRGRQRVRLIGI